MSMYTTAQLLAANEQKFKFDPLFLRLFFRESYPFTTEKVYLSQIPGLVNMALYVSPIVSGEVIGAHTHSVAIGSHGHTITVNAAGNAENTVKNIAFNYIVRLA